VGAVRVRSVVLSSFALDGGAMHGIVPRTLWARIHRPDERNRIRLVARALVVDDVARGTRALLDLGMGRRWTDKERQIYALEDGPDARDALAADGIDPDTITHVVLTHLHWDHAGGLLRGRDDAGPRELAFPRAEHVLGAAALLRAKHPNDKDRGSFRFEDVAHLCANGRVREARAGDEVAPGVVCEISNGHTEGLLVLRIHERDDGPPLAFPTDLVPTRSHLRTSWVAAYDCLPVVAVDEKVALFESLVSEGGGVVLYHDPDVEAAYPRRVDGGALDFAHGTLEGPSEA
jgi:glyoxylase-like metal-dependent hydrolase (beta-lactamase superfamily II)